MGGGEPAGAGNVDGEKLAPNHVLPALALFAKGRPSQIVCTVRKEGVTVLCDGEKVISWQGKPERLSLSEYWKTPHDNALLLGAMTVATVFRGSRNADSRRREEIAVSA